MAREVQHFEVTIPAGTAKSAPATTALTMPARVVRSVRFRFPPGCGGLVGFYLSMGGNPVMPQPAKTFVTDDDGSGTWTLEDQPDSGAWQITGYNTGIYPHTLRLAFHVDLIAKAEPPLRLISPVLLSHYSSQAG